MATNDSYIQIVSHIIKGQEQIIGPIALEQAQKISGLKVASPDDVTISGNAKDVLENLVKQYAKLFGQTSIEVCKEAVRDVGASFSKDDLPPILQ